MFSLIITVISIALVAALALATLYYGGTAFSKGSSEAQASRIVLQGQQVLGAAELYFTDNRAWPATMQVLIEDGYLKAIPTVRGPMGEALAADATWEMVEGGQPVFKLATAVPEVCQTVNKRTWGSDGVLTTAHTDYTIQCFGEADDSLLTVVGRGEALLEVSGSLDVTVGSAPSDPTDDAWYIAPGGAGAGAGGGGANKVVLSTNSHRFPDTPVGGWVEEVAAVITNNTAGAVTLIDVNSEDDNLFWVSFGLDCYNASFQLVPLAPGASCTIEAGFDPYEGPVNNLHTEVLVETSWGNLSFDLIGTGTGQLPLEAPVAFFKPGEQYVWGGTIMVPAPAPGGSAFIDIPLTNPAPVAQNIASLTFSDDLLATAARIGLTATNVNCPAQLAAGATCTVRATFAPSLPGSWEMRWLQVKDSNGVQIGEVRVSAYTEMPSIPYLTVVNAGYPQLNNDNDWWGNDSALGALPQNVPFTVPATLTNVTPYAASIIIEQMVSNASYDPGSDQYAFATADTSACPELLQPGASCTVNFVVTPRVTGQNTRARYTIYFNNSAQKWVGLSFQGE